LKRARGRSRSAPAKTTTKALEGVIQDLGVEVTDF
jgi:hypothetical protein